MPSYLLAAVRSVFLILGIFIIAKLLGKKQLSKLSFFEYITGITVGDIAGTLSMDPNLSLTDGVTSIVIWSIFPIILSVVSLKSPKIRHIVEGKPTVFIENGKIKEKGLRKEKYSTDELLEQLRKKDIFKVADVEFATLDTNGDLSVLLKRSKQPLTYGDFGGKEHKTYPPQAVINDGEIDDEMLRMLGLNEKWLTYELEKKGIEPDQVFFAQADQKGELTFDLYDKNENNP
ncbi:DUF421 domain-containing protein [Falsibacillus albus]|uniref:DUF421 domain-containing protein n=1 Tax=Falsibacillus albus TaxID=2478915 RepID=A0A3L7K2W8_9BACI|nr:DUF421 domain-containing protein [Falsibacillus albus]RLQ97160.1 DUF421 domain-containing protein [Falsibacillus albus]